MPETNASNASVPAAPTPPVSNPAFAGISTSPVVPKAPEAVVRPVRKPAEPKSGWWWGTGRRKTAVARVRIRPAKGAEGTVQVQVDARKYKPVEQYFAEERDRNDCFAPLRATNMVGRLDVIIRCSGGGFMGQAGAVKLGIARALRAYDPTLEQALRDNGFLTRDARDVERKKYGQAGARRRFQFSKR